MFILPAYSVLTEVSIIATKAFVMQGNAALRSALLYMRIYENGSTDKDNDNIFEMGDTKFSMNAAQNLAQGTTFNTDAFNSKAITTNSTKSFDIDLRAADEQHSTMAPTTFDGSITSGKVRVFIRYLTYPDDS